MAFSIRSLFNPDNDPPHPPSPVPEPSPSLLFKVVEGKATNSAPVSSPQPQASPLTVGDILSSLPGEALALELPDFTLPLSLDRNVIEKALRSGHAALPLHEVYQACPTLFAQPVSADDPRQVSLPPDKIVKLLAATGASPMAGTASSVDRPAVRPAAVKSVFSVADTEADIGMKDDPAAGLLSQESPLSAIAANPASPFAVADNDTSPPASASANPFERISALGRSEEPAKAPATAAAPTSSPDEKITLPLAAALQFCREEDLGIDPALLPDSVDVTLPVEVFQRQLASGEKPCVRLRELRIGLQNEHKVLLAAARPELMVRLPTDVLSLSPQDAEAGEPMTPAEAPPATSKPVLEESLPLPAISGTEESDPFAEMPLMPDWDSVETASPQQQEEAPFDFPPLPGLSQPVEAPAPFAPPQSAFPPAPSAPPPASPAFTGFTLAPQAPAPTTSSSALVPVSLPARHPNKRRRMLLRVLLGTHEDLDAESVVQKIITLPGVIAVGCVYRHALFTSASHDSAAGQNFVTQVLPIHQHLLPLTEFSGLEGTETITLRSEEYLASFALHPELTLGVLHAPGLQETELLEKITLLTTELAAMLASESGPA